MVVDHEDEDGDPRELQNNGETKPENKREIRHTFTAEHFTAGIKPWALPPDDIPFERHDFNGQSRDRVAPSEIPKLVFRCKHTLAKGITLSAAFFKHDKYGWLVREEFAAENESTVISGDPENAAIYREFPEMTMLLETLLRYSDGSRSLYRKDWDRVVAAGEKWQFVLGRILFGTIDRNGVPFGPMASILDIRRENSKYPPRPPGEPTPPGGGEGGDLPEPGGPSQMQLQIDFVKAEYAAIAEVAPQGAFGTHSASAPAVYLALRTEFDPAQQVLDSEKGMAMQSRRAIAEKHAVPEAFVEKMEESVTSFKWRLDCIKRVNAKRHDQLLDELRKAHEAHQERENRFNGVLPPARKNKPKKIDGSKSGKDGTK